MSFYKRPTDDEDKSVLYGTVGFIVIGALVIVLGYAFGWI